MVLKRGPKLHPATVYDEEYHITLFIFMLKSITRIQKLLSLFFLLSSVCFWHFFRILILFILSVPILFFGPRLICNSWFTSVVVWTWTTTTTTNLMELNFQDFFFFSFSICRWQLKRCVREYEQEKEISQSMLE